MNRLANVCGIFIFVFFLSGCFNSTSDYDAVSYRNLTDLKTEMEASFNNYTVKGAKGENDMSNFIKFKDDIAKGYEFAKGKEKDDNVLAQWNILNSQADEMVHTFRNIDSLSSGYCLEKWRIMNEALDKAIKAKEK